MPSHETADPVFPILIGDIGGTNARFSILTDATAAPMELPNIRTAEFPTIDDAIRQDVFQKTDIRPRSAILAVAGPIQGDEIPLTNCPWVVRPKQMIAALGLEDVMVVNDFEAQALAIATLGEDDREALGPMNASPTASRVVLGPGTGLGVAGLVYAQGRWFPIPGEGGHVDIGPRSARDYAIFPHIETIEGRVAGEQILCGRGLVHLYTAICIADGVTPKFTDPKDVTEHAEAGSDAQAMETVDLFVTYLARLAGDLALIFMAKGGVFLAGGIPQKIMHALRQPQFRAAFEDKAPHTEMMKTISTFVVTHPRAALAGLAAYARAPSDFGLATRGRRWTTR
ncbi:glucokinase [Rhizobium halophytocola]|uniref:Glucokinase n=1 Tax=Rhizobium halophytocola TaxID=735519 RepID=A0ABS4E189_9HYPH|nr:glucokinase [Rhizobium halophytocola]MBP1851709.1 glucokinase [Rhizobium halophytocola]